VPPSLPPRSQAPPAAKPTDGYASNGESPPIRPRHVVPYAAATEANPETWAAAADPAAFAVDVEPTTTAAAACDAFGAPFDLDDEISSRAVADVSSAPSAPLAPFPTAHAGACWCMLVHAFGRFACPGRRRGAVSPAGPLASSTRSDRLSLLCHRAPPSVACSSPPPPASAVLLPPVGFSVSPAWAPPPWAPPPHR
jgi:hypothetical protein